MANGGAAASASGAEELERLSQSALTLLQQSLLVSRPSSSSSSCASSASASAQAHSHSTSETEQDGLRGPRAGRSASAAFSGEGFAHAQAAASAGAGVEQNEANGIGFGAARRPPHLQPLQAHSMQNLPSASPTHMSSSYAPPSSVPSSSSSRDGCLLYSKLLLTLPALYSLRREHVQALFCRQTDIDVDAVLGATLATCSLAASPV